MIQEIRRGSEKSNISSMTHCLDLDVNDKRPGTTSDNGFIFKKVNKNKKSREKKKSCGRFWRAALTEHGQSSQLADF